MLFNKKLIMGLCNILGVLLILNFLFFVVMYTWAFFGKPPVQLFDVSRGFPVHYDFVVRIAAFVFFYVMLAAFAALVKSSKLREGFKK